MKLFNHDTHGHFPSSHIGSSMKKVGYEVALKDKKQIAEDTYAFIFEKPNGFHFKAGQHVRMTLLNPPETDSEGNSRFLSFVNTPQDVDLIFAMRMRDTAFKRVLGRMQMGDKVLIEMLLNNPHGSFTLHDDPSKPAVFLIGGIGIVPAFSMIKDALERNLPHTIFLFYSNRRPEDAPFLQDLENLAKQYHSFKLIPTMTEPEKSAISWQGATGHIDQSLLKKYVSDLQSPIYYIAGLPEMVKTMQTSLKKLGINEDNIRAEEFSGFKMNHNNNSINPQMKSHIMFMVIGLIIAIGVIVHATGAISLFHSISLKNISYFTVGLLVAVVIFKVFVIVKFKHVFGFLYK